ncbi:MAG: class I tRNA ligase family protein, partial [Mycobacterium sp.]|nr:class I tRNA ligase family protein [Mycobacterium sp.]
MANCGVDGAQALPKSWDPGAVEHTLYEGWVDAGYFSADAASDKPAYSIVLPPPNVTGNLHMGHALDHTLMDALTRRKRMQGYEVLWLPGMDHAGIATQSVVEKQLAVDGKTKEDLGRELFIDKVWEWKRESGGTIGSQMRALGDGVDWSRDRFTMDDGLSRAVRTIFKRLFDAGLIYRAERLVNWSPVLETAISDLEVKYADVEGELVSFRYGSTDDDEPHIVVATTRLETMLGDTAIAVHPDDDRYRHLVGQTLPHPFLTRDIVVVADDHVDPEFGTGAVKVTPAHDPNDFDIGVRHHLPMPSMLDTKGRIADTGTPFDGMDRFEARVAVREALAEQGRIVAEKRPYLHSVGHSERSGEPIEPRLSLQWWVKVESLAKAAGDAVRNGD